MSGRPQQPNPISKLQNGENLSSPKKKKKQQLTEWGCVHVELEPHHCRAHLLIDIPTPLQMNVLPQSHGEICEIYSQILL